jgi:hypothetical protein
MLRKQIATRSSSSASDGCARRPLNRREEIRLQMARRRIRESQVLVSRQHEIVIEMRARGYPVEMAEAILKGFEELLREQENDLKSCVEKQDPDRWPLSPSSIYAPLRSIGAAPLNGRTGLPSDSDLEASVPTPQPRRRLR